MGTDDSFDIQPDGHLNRTYLAIVHPMWHKISFTKTKADIVAVVIWVFGVSFNASTVIATTTTVLGVCYTSSVVLSRDVANAVASIHIVVEMALPMIVHSFCYMRILVALRKRNATVSPDDATEQTKNNHGTKSTTRTTAKVGVSLPSTSGTYVTTNCKASVSTDRASRSSDKQHHTWETQNEKAKRNVAKTLAIVTACYFICWLPSKIYVMLMLTGALSTYGDIYFFTVILAFTNCCVNPIIYIGKYDAFRTGLSMLFRPPR